MDAPQASDFDAVVERTRQGLVAFVRGDPSGMRSLFSRRQDVVLANPLGPPQRGPSGVDEVTGRTATLFRDGSIEFEELTRYVTPDLGFVFHIEHTRAKIGNSDEVHAIGLRVTMIYRREQDGWKIIHRQADPIVTPRPIESIFEQ